MAIDQGTQGVVVKQTSAGHPLFSAMLAIAVEGVLLQPCRWVGNLVVVVEQVENHVERQCVDADAVVGVEVEVTVVRDAADAVKVELAESAEIVEAVSVGFEVVVAEMVEVVFVEDVVEVAELVCSR